MCETGHHGVAKATLFVMCTSDGCATFWSPVMSSEVMWIMWSASFEWCLTHLPNSEIFIAQNNAFFIVTGHVVKDAVDAEWVWDNNGYTIQHYDVIPFEHVLWHNTMHELVMNIHYQTWIAQRLFINISRTPSKQWGMCDNLLFLCVLPSVHG